jgi:hypothetical protein
MSLGKTETDLPIEGINRIGLPRLGRMTVP